MRIALCVHPELLAANEQQLALEEWLVQRGVEPHAADVERDNG